jgi:hypothetical protein
MDLAESAVLVRINIVNERFKPYWPKYGYKQADCAGNGIGPTLKIISTIKTIAHLILAQLETVFIEN